jgi:hypothetical protein
MLLLLLEILKMPRTKLSAATAKRYGVIADAVIRAIYAMKLVNGVAIENAGVHGVLQFDHEMARLEEALRLIKADCDDTTSIWH